MFTILPQAVPVASTLALFDLDNTLLAVDSDYLWGRFLATEGVVDGPTHEARNAHFYAQYTAGELDIHAFLRFALAPLAALAPRRLLDLRARFLAEHIAPNVARHAPPLLARHRAAGHLLVIVTATNRFVTGPIAALLGADALLATDPELRGGRFSGNAMDPPCYRAGKVELLARWCARYAPNADIAYAYSDSHNDLPLLERAHRAVAVDPDPRLRAHAAAHAWPVVSLRGAEAPWRLLDQPV